MKIRSNFTLSEHARQWADETGNASAYIEELLDEAQAAYVAAYTRLSSRYSRPAIMAVLDVLNGHLFTEGMDPTTEIVANLEDAPELREKWSLSDAEWSGLLGMDRRDGETFRTLAREFWRGRRLP